jgi:glucose/mannose transport system permease protein
MGLEATLHRWGFESVSFNWLAQGDTAMYAIILASVWQSAGFYMALMIAGLKSSTPRSGAAARLDGVSLWRPLHRDHHPDDEVHLPDLRDPAVAGSHQGLRHRPCDDERRAGGSPPGCRPTSSSTPSRQKQNLGYASAAAVMMLIITAAGVPAARPADRLASPPEERRMTDHRFGRHHRRYR